MLDPILNGIVFGLLLAVMIGPVFFALLQTALHEGFKAGVYLAFGVLMSDAACITVVFFFASQIDLTGKYKLMMSIAGGILLVAFGIYNFMKQTKVKEVDDDKKTVHAKFVLKGFVLNSVNPVMLLFWLSVMSVVKAKEDYTGTHEAVFFVSVLTTVFCTDLLKSFVAHKIKDLLKPNVLLWINRIVGVVLIIFGLRMILKII